MFLTFTTSSVLAIRRTSLLWSSPLSCSAALWMLKQQNVFTGDTAFIYIISVGKSVHIFTARKRISKSCLITELCFNRFVHFAFWLCSYTYIYIYIYISHILYIFYILYYIIYMHMSYVYIYIYINIKLGVIWR